MLRDQFSEHPSSFEQFNRHDVLRIKQMQDSYKSGIIELFTGSKIDSFSDAILPSLEKSSKPHKGLVMDIYRNQKTLLEPFTGPIEMISDEFPIIFGSLDLMAISNRRCAYVIEVKTDQADHSIVGQVMKYYIGLCLKLILKFWDEVKIITICPGYDESAYNGLRQIGAQPLLINIPKMRIIF